MSCFFIAKNPEKLGPNKIGYYRLNEVKKALSEGLNPLHKFGES